MVKGNEEWRLHGHLCGLLERVGFSWSKASPKELVLCKKLMTAYGFEAFDMAACMVADWPAIKRRFAWSGQPTVVALWTLRDKIHAAVSSGKGFTDGLHRVSKWSKAAQPVEKGPWV